MFIDKVRITCEGRRRRRRAACRSAARPTCPRAAPTAATAVTAATSSSRPTPRPVLAHRVPLQAPLQGRARHPRPAAARMHGATGEDLVLKVPVGTVVREYFEEDGGSGRADRRPHPRRRVASPWRAGGMGGRGNIHFVTSTRRAPAFAELGEPAAGALDRAGDEAHGRRGLGGHAVGGQKSSLIAKMSAARPKIADYPFTTLVPNLGVATSGDLLLRRGRHPRPHRRGLTRAAGWDTSSCATSSARPSSCRSSI